MSFAEELYPEEYKTISMFSTLYSLRCRTDGKEWKEIFRQCLFDRTHSIFSDITNEADSNCNYIEGIHVNITRQLMDLFPIENESLSKLQKKIEGSSYDLGTVLICLAYIWPNHVILDCQTMSLNERLLKWKRCKKCTRLPDDLKVTMWDFCGSKSRLNPDASTQVNY